jgi:hypothetical protein
LTNYNRSSKSIVDILLLTTTGRKQSFAIIEDKIILSYYLIGGSGSSTRERFVRNQYSSGEKEHASFKFSVRENPQVSGRIFIIVGLERQLSIRRLDNIIPRHSQNPRLSLEVIKIIIKVKRHVSTEEDLSVPAMARPGRCPSERRARRARPWYSSPPMTRRLRVYIFATSALSFIGFQIHRYGVV